MRSPKELRLHDAMEKLGWTSFADEVTEAARSMDQGFSQAIYITASGIVLSGFGRWQLALSEGVDEICCIEYALNDYEALRFILAHYQPRRGWNAFIRICLALAIEPDLQQKALENMRAGGRYKGSTNLPDPDRIDVRREIANEARVGTGNVSKVKTILLRVHPVIITALQNDVIKIHRAWKWCGLSKAQQKIELERYEEARFVRRNLRKLFPEQGAAVQVLTSLVDAESLHPGSITICRGSGKRTVVVLGCATGMTETQKEFKLDA
jgi:hypothetical protein